MRFQSKTSAKQFRSVGGVGRSEQLRDGTERGPHLALKMAVGRILQGEAAPVRRPMAGGSGVPFQVVCRYSSNLPPDLSLSLLKICHLL